MADADAGGGRDSGSSSDGVESGAESMETAEQNSENGESELYTNDGEQELYDPGYDANEYEAELMDFSYDLDDPSSFEADTEIHCNKDGEPVDEVPVVVDQSYIQPADDYNDTGKWAIDWESYAENSDTDGFDKSEPITTVKLQPGTVFARYGSERGRFATDVGTEYSKLSLPYDPSSQEYHEYRVIEPVSCQKGTAAKNFGQEGKGTQYMFSDTLAEMSDPSNPNRTLERIR